MNNISNLKLAFWGNGPYALIALQELVSQNSPIKLVVFTGKDYSVSNFAKEKNIPVIRYDSNVNSYIKKQHRCHPEKSLSEARRFTQDPVKIPRDPEQSSVTPRVTSDFQDDNLKNKLKDMDVCLVASFGEIIPQDILTIPEHGFLNIHPSLLPRHRGPAPVVSEILSGDKQGGVTIIKLDKEMDHGPILAQIKDSPDKDDYAKNIYKKRFGLGAKKLIEIISDYVNHNLNLKEQDHSQATYSKTIRKQDGLLDLKNKQYSSAQIWQMIRAYTPWPGVYFKWLDKNNKEQIITLLKAKIESNVIIPKEYKKILFAKDKRLFLNLKSPVNQSLEIMKLKIAGKREMNAGDFINGYLK